MIDRAASQQSSNCNSTVDRAACEQLPGSISTVGAGSISTVTGQHVNSEPTVEMQLKGGHSGRFTRGDSNLSGEIFAGLTSQEGSATSSAPGARGLEPGSDSHVDQKLKTEQVTP